MNFQEFYKKTENRLTDSILSLWFTGDKEMQDYIRFLFSQEPIIAEAIFQNTFPWENENIVFGDTINIFNSEFIDSLDKIKNDNYKFPKTRKPYKHQLKSWKSLLKDKKSIAVTTGTGSGKTECFMLPVLQDIHENCKNSNGINALFLYPLNALIESQRKRMHEWCNALGGINYALLTGATENRVSSKKDKKKASPQLISREQIRDTPPQILFTNPTMLEYMLVRNSDAPILKKSKGTLRWILLDEAHTLTGSKAAEMALLIRRVVVAFGVKLEDLRFAITSATVGDGNTDSIKRFMSDLCGIEENQIVVIEGKRVNNQISDKEVPDLSPLISKDKIIKLRNYFLNSKAVDNREIKKITGISDRYEQLQLIDNIADIKINNENLLPVRGHFFTRGVGGVYVCTNAKCDKHKNKKPTKAIGTMYTIANKKCSSCKHPLLELIACPTCGNMMLEGERAKDKVVQKVSTGYEAFQIENEDDDIETKDENIENTLKDNLVRFVKNGKDNNFNEEELLTCSLNEENTLDYEGEHLLMSQNNQCIHCSTQIKFPIHFRISSSFTNRILSDIVLDQTQKLEGRSSKAIYKGRKYISFTDSRQGTAKIAALINQDGESNWIRYQIYHLLIKKLKENKLDVSNEELLKARALYVTQLEDALPFMRKGIEDNIAKTDKQLSEQGESNTVESRTKWTDIIEFIKPKDDFKTLYNKIARGHSRTSNEIDAYAKSLIYDQFARRLPRERSLENLGLVNIVYPSLDDIILPEIAKELEIKESEYRNLLKIAVDYIIRLQFHFSFDSSLQAFSTKLYRSYSIFSINTEVTNAKKWISFKPKSKVQSRFVLLVCAGLGWHDKEDINREKEDQLNQFFEKIWRTLKEKVLTPEGEGFKLDLMKKTRLEIAGEEFLCPVKKRLVDKTFRGYSPWIKGQLTPENIQYYKIDSLKIHSFPTFPYPNHLDEENNIINLKLSEDWISENSKEAKNKGIWNNLHERVYNFDKFYIAGEHSAQQSKKRLMVLENQFENGELNILSCSTTMEMGVDIGGISAVVMSNVPPMPANYLQRTGRAGRRSENKSLALTFCAPNPIGLRTMNNPKWALDHKIASPTLTFDSKSIVERHVNSLLFGIFIQQNNEGLNIRENIEKFFFEGSNTTIAFRFLKWLEELESSQFKKEINAVIKGTPLMKNSAEFLTNKVLENFQEIIDIVKLENKDLEEKLNELEKTFGDNSPAYKAVNFRKGKFLKTHILNYLAEVRFLPNAGLPTGIVDFEKTTIGDLKKEHNTRLNTNPSYSLERALTEFAPGNYILIDGLNYKSAGIIMKNTWGQAGKEICIQGCKKCGFQREVSLTEEVNDNCPECNSKDSFKGVDLIGDKKPYTELVEPAGFAVDLYKDPSRVISEKNKPQYLEPLLLNVKPWKAKQASYLDFRTSEQESNSQILFYNTGEGAGYSICFDCGRTETNHEKLDGHTRLRGGKNNDQERKCDAKHIKDHIILGSKFTTDFTELRLLNSDGAFVKNENMIYTLGVILTKALAERLAIEGSELGFGIKKYKKYKTIFIYDTARGGAGYASQFSIHADEIIKIAYEVLHTCGCEDACTKCLIDRSTQWHLEKLNKNLALEWLNKVKSNQLPDALKHPSLKISSIFGSLNDEIRKLNYHHGIKSVNIHLNNKVEEWDSENLTWLTNLNRKDIEVDLIVEGDLVLSNNQDKLTFHILARNNGLKRGRGNTIHEYPIHLTVVLKNEVRISYISRSGYLNLNSHSLGSSEEKYFKIIDENEYDYNNLSLPALTNSKLFEARISGIPRGSFSKDLASILNNSLADSNEFRSKIKGRRFSVSYFDKYNQSEFSLRLLLQFIDKIKTVWNIDITNFNVHLDRKMFRSDREPRYLIDNFTTKSEYEDVFLDLSEDYSFESEIIDENKLPHYRIFKFNDEKGGFTMRIDGGISHGLKPIEYLKRKDMSNESFKIRKDVDYDLIYNVSTND